MPDKAAVTKMCCVLGWAITVLYALVTVAGITIIVRVAWMLTGDGNA